MSPRSKQSPIYIQIADSIREQIETNQLHDGDKLLSEREMCEKYQVSRISVRKALEILEKDGLINAIHGKGSFVCDRKINDSLFEISTFGETISQKGYEGFTNIVSFDEYASDHTYDIMFETSSSGTSELKLLGYVNSVPAVFYDSLIIRPLSLQFYTVAEELAAAHKPFSSFDLYKQTQTPIGRIKQTVKAENSSSELATILDIPPSTAVLVLESLIFSEDMQPIEYKKGYYRTDRYTFNLYRTL